MCQYCSRYGTTLVSYPWPSSPVVIVPLPPMSPELAELVSLWNNKEYWDKLRDKILTRQTR
jgi:hypothetical protein